jgi:predicted RNA binding protein YcfA (HicA-like mRNA interferase family)
VIAVSGKQMCRALERKGWRLHHIKGSHHVYKAPSGPGTISVPVHGNQTLKPGTQRGMMRAAGLTEDDR